MEPAQVVAERALDRGSVVGHMEQEMLDASGQVGEGAARMRQDDLQVGILVERAGINEFAREKSVFNGSVDPGCERGRPGRPAAAEGVDHTIHLMKNDRIVQFLNARQNRRKAWIEYIVLHFDGIWEVNGAHTGLSGDAV